RRQCLVETDGFPETPPLSGDYLTWFRISLRHRFDYVADPVFEYRISRDALSRDLATSLQARITLFSRLLAQTSDPRTADELRRLLFQLDLALVTALVRRRSLRALKNLRRPQPRGAGFRQQVRWLLQYVGNHLRVRWGRFRATPAPG